MFTPQVAFALGYGPAKLQAAHVERADIAKLPELAHVVTLELRNQGISDADIEALAAASKTMKGPEGVGLQLNRVHDPADQLEFYDETHRERVATDAGEALEAKYGRIAWLHPPE
jgi:hypothetical protein